MYLIINISPIEEIIDEAVIKRSGWLMYGSRKQDRDPYELTKVINSNGEETLYPSLTVLEKVNLFSKLPCIGNARLQNL